MIRLALAAALFLLAGLDALAVAWFICSAAAATRREVKVLFAVLAQMAALIVCVLASAGAVLV